MIALLTDFGLDDAFVGEMKGVILGIHPGAVIVDVTHGIAPGAIREGAWVLARTLGSFPAGTVHVAVVDPGVGTERRALAVRCGDRLLVGPDNGLLMTAIETLGGKPEIREISTRELDRVRRGTTFDGRDVFAPTGARLAAGLDPAELGPEVHDPVPMPSFAPRKVEGGFEVEVVRIDRFGNVILSADESFCRQFGESWRKLVVTVGEERLEGGVHLGYGDVEPGEPLLVIGGSGTLEISIHRGSADRKFDLSAGDRVLLSGPPEL